METVNVNKRLDLLREKIQTKDFLEGKGLSNEVNIRIFCYDPKDEMVIRYFLNQLENASDLRCKPIICNLYELFLEFCEKKKLTDAKIQKLEKSKGTAHMLAQLQKSIKPDLFTAELEKRFTEQNGDVLILSHIGEVFPYTRLHAILNAFKEFESEKPILAFYPGIYNGRELILFDKLPPSDYYRAFNEI